MVGQIMKKVISIIMIACSKTAYSNFEIVQFEPDAPGEYKIVIKIVGASNIMEYVGLAIW